jgi:hypothetical protein
MTIMAAASRGPFQSWYRVSAGCSLTAPLVGNRERGPLGALSRINPLRFSRWDFRLSDFENAPATYWLQPELVLTALKAAFPNLRMHQRITSSRLNHVSPRLSLVEPHPNVTVSILINNLSENLGGA